MFASDDCKNKEQFFDILVEQVIPYDEWRDFEDVAACTFLGSVPDAMVLQTLISKR